MVRSTRGKRQPEQERETKGPRRRKRDGLSRMWRAVQGACRAARHADQRETVTSPVAAFPTLKLLPVMPIRLVEKLVGDTI